MRSLTVYSQDCFKFFLDVLKAKHKSDSKTRLQGIESDIKALFQQYQSSFTKNEIQELLPHGFEGDIKEDLLKLYRFRSKALQDLKESITTDEYNRVINTCQNCTINSINSFDHIIPKESFPEFSVNPYNLFPSCTECNGYKGEKWVENGERLFLNLFLDELPKVNYLKVNFNFSPTVITTEYYLENDNVNQTLWSIINNHYRRLYLLDRFAQNSHEVISEFINTVESFSSYINDEDLIKILRVC